jgi:endonuclease/exonuclease/phosphatase (EEP) superfamily protein YafD
MEAAVTVSARPSRWRRLARLVVSAAFAVACLWWLVLLVGPEHHWLTGALLYLPYWLYLPPVLVVAALAWTLGWRWGVVALATLAIVLWPIMGFSIGTADSGAGRLRLMTYNIKSYMFWEAGAFDRVAAEIEQHDPDVILMQDAVMITSQEARRSSALRRLVGTRNIYAFGQYIVASRFPIRDCKVGDISYDEVSHTMVSCVVRAHGFDIDLHTVHFISPRDGLNAFRWQGFAGHVEWQANLDARMLQSDKIAGLLARRSRSAIVAGDFNAPEQSLVIRKLLDAGMRDAFSRAGWGYGYTHGHALRLHPTSTTRIDHILVSREIGVEDCFAGGKEGSEHRPVIADLWLY